MDKRQLATMYSDFLSDEGYRPEIDGDGDVRFKSEGLIYYIIIDEKDPDYFRLLLPNFWSIDSDLERSRVLVAADYATSSTKAAKVYTVGNNVWASIEFFYKSPQHFKDSFTRHMSCLRTAADNFAKKMTGQA